MQASSTHTSRSFSCVTFVYNTLILITFGGFLDRGSSVVITTPCGVNGLGIESRWSEIFRTRPNRPHGLPNLLYNGYRVSFPRVKLPGRGVNHPRPSSAEVREGLELYIFLEPSWPVPGRNLPLPLPCRFLLLTDVRYVADV
jgi:hypothetical protein